MQAVTQAVTLAAAQEGNYIMIETTAPISIDNLKKYFEDKDTSFLIDYEQSELKGDKLLVYLSNLAVPCDLKNFDADLVEAYLRTTMLVNIPSVEMEVIRLLFLMKEGQPVPFVDLLMDWERKIDSLTLYNMYVIDVPEFKTFVESFPEDDTKSLEGINFVSLLKNEEMYVLFEKIREENLTNFTSYFNEYMFGGKNLYSFWANGNNPLFLLTWGIATDEIKKAAA